MEHPNGCGPAWMSRLWLTRKLQRLLFNWPFQAIRWDTLTELVGGSNRCLLRVPGYTTQIPTMGSL